MREDAGMPGRNGVSGPIDRFAAKRRWFILGRAMLPRKPRSISCKVIKSLDDGSELSPNVLFFFFRAAQELRHDLVRKPCRRAGHLLPKPVDRYRDEPSDCWATVSWEI